jgi:predicted dehydrogenase
MTGPSPSPLRAAVIGTGFIGPVHVRAARLAGAEVVGVAASSPESARRAAADLGVERAFDSSEEAAEHPDVDVVHVCTPNHLHEPLALRALAAGKHVICEKPVALDAAGAERVRRAGEAAGRVVAVPFVYRFSPVIRDARALVAGGEVGAVRLIHGTYLQDWLATPDDTNWRVDAALSGASRAFADIGSHWCDLVEFVSGHRITRLVAQMATVVEERPATARPTFVAGSPGGGDGGDGSRVPVTTEDLVTVLFRTDRGATGSVVISQVSPGRKNRLWFEIDGTEASVAFDQEDAERLWVGRRRANSIVMRDPVTGSADSARLSFLPAGHAQGYADCFDLFVADAYAAIRTGEVPVGLPLAADGARSALIVDAVLASAHADGWVDVAAAAAPADSEVPA